MDIAGCSSVDDQGFAWLLRQEVSLRVGVPPTVPGLIRLRTLKAGNTKFTDSSIHLLASQAPLVAHLELQRCDLTDDGLQ